MSLPQIQALKASSVPPNTLSSTESHHRARTVCTRGRIHKTGTNYNQISYQQLQSVNVNCQLQLGTKKIKSCKHCPEGVGVGKDK